MAAGDGQHGAGTHFPSVKTILTVLVVLAMLGTVGVLFAGLLGLVTGQDSARSNKLMRYRVVLQGVALLLFVVLLSLLKS